ncbi:cytochrome P450 CYP72A616-like [Nicotiana tomentosiformis]|uniref:cytochrome P450 CYP72A616-like n=1 Tax=Nicotiana tomentosiformis TaxID=4098 RepID=UPI00051B99BA|nr:cytochrome P450 CYP72A219-like [Nicotiana tomentosiformis]
MAGVTLIAATIFGILVAIVCVKFLYKIWWWPKMMEKKLKKQGIHGHPYKFLFGNLIEMMRMSKEAKSKPLSLTHDIMPWLNPFLQHLANNHRKIFVMWAGPTPRITVTDPKLIRELLNKHQEFHKPEANAFIEMFVTGLAGYNGEKWATHRKIVTPAFHIEKIKRMFSSAFGACVEEMIIRWEELVSKTETCELDVEREFMFLGGDVISRAAFGSNIEEGRSIFLLQKEQCELILASPFTLFFPWLRFLPTASNRKARDNYKKVRGMIRGIIKKREDAERSGITMEDNDDILGLLLKSRNEEKNKSKAGLTTDDVIEECKEFYLAGQDTTSALLTWTLVALSMHPEWQDKARKEVLHVIGKNKPKFDDLNQLRIMTMIFQEVLRLYPALLLYRSTSKSCKLGDMTIPAGVQVFVPTHLVHRDCEVWGNNALLFNPERFSEGVSKAAGKEHQLYIPFGWGARMCIGLNFGMLEAKLALSRILQLFWFELSPSYTHAPHCTLILKPQYGAHIILHKL